MSDIFASSLLPPENYIQQHVGGKEKPKNNVQYINNQLKILSEDDKYLPPNLRTKANKINQNQNQNQYIQPNVQRFNLNIPSNRQVNSNLNDVNFQTTNQNSGFRNVYMTDEQNRYDPYTGYLYNQGLMSDGTNKRRFTTTYLSIDSSFRVQTPSSTLESAYNLSANPVVVTQNSSNIFITQANCPYSLGDLVQIINVVGNLMILRTFDNYGNPTFDIPNGANFIRFTIPNPGHQIPLAYMGTSLQVTISGIRGDIGNITTLSYLGTVPINTINTTSSIIVNYDTSTLDPTLVNELIAINPNYFIPSNNVFFVDLPVTMTTTYNLKSYNYTIEFDYIGGVPLSLINAAYPIGPDNLQGYNTIINVVTNGFYITVPTIALFSQIGGGISVNVAQISAINPGYPNPNSYNIDLGMTLHNIISVRLISSEFPNTETAITTSNNLIYWNDIDDGEYLYSIAVPPGNYTASDLITAMQNLFLTVPRINASTNLPAGYSPYHYIRVTISQNTSQVVFASYKQFCEVEPIINISPPIAPIATAANQTAEAQAQYTLTILQPGHGMRSPGLTILIQGAIATMGIPADVLNTSHIVTTIIDQNTYTITLPKCSFNLSASRQNTMGGGAVNIFIPDLFRLRFDYPNTLGGVLGFRNPGNSNSYFAFAYTIANNDPYLFDTELNSFGQPTNITNNALQLSGNNYIVMVANPLTTIDTNSPIKNAFAKILLNDVPGKMLFNSFVNTVGFFVDPLNELSQLSVAFYDPGGTLYNFNGLNHSYTLEIITVNDIPEGTGINSNTGKNYNLDVAAPN